jgi:hypothetical protein
METQKPSITILDHLKIGNSNYALQAMVQIKDFNK